MKNLLLNEDYSYIKELKLVQTYLKQCLVQKRVGVNILIYGKSGTGKSEFAKFLAKSVGVNLHKSFIGDKNELEASENIALYDDIDENLDNKYGKSKSSLKAILENNEIIAIWVLDKLDNIDKSIIRRFDFVIKMPTPSKAVLENMLKKICENKLDEATLHLACNFTQLTPAIIKRAYEISLMLDGNFSQNFLAVAKNTLKAQKYKKRNYIDSTAFSQSYSLEFINTNCDVKALVKGIKANENARICLYGVSGTGKSAFAKYLAKELNRPCIIKSVSDLESCFVGSTEKNISKAFKEAKKQRAVLVFDEVDSFLRDRSTAVRDFEASKVNEMLTQMEKFDGIFIATTNLMDMLDKAALRRFDIKLEFKALNARQRVKLFKKECELLKLVDSGEKAKISRLEFLTAGDFAAVKRQMKFAPIKNANDFYKRLCEEVKVKGLNERARMGFIAG